MNTHYKVIYTVESYTTPHYRFYTASDEQTARSMFSEACNEYHPDSSVKILEVVQIDNPDVDCCNPDSCSC